MVLFRLVMYGSIQKKNFIGGSNHLLELRPFLSGVKQFQIVILKSVDSAMV